MAQQTGRMGEIELPFRIMPSRERNFFPAYLFVGVGVAIILGALIWGHGLAKLIALPGLGGGVIGAFMYRREKRFSDDGASYWFVASTASFSVVTPDESREYPWGDLGPFVVTREVSQTREQDGSSRTSVSYKLAARGPNADEKIEIPLGDFATRFEGGEERRAEAMAEALNALRQFCGHAAAGQAFLVPAGLAVAPMPKARAPRAIVAGKSVERA